jgi:hypothetical protein
METVTAPALAAITVEGKVLGQRRLPFAPWTLPLEAVEAGSAEHRPAFTLRHLIGLVVAAEVAAFRERQDARRVVRVLTEREIDADAARGKVAPGGSNEAEPAAPDPADALHTALQAFRDGLYYVFVDDAQRTDLDEEIELRPDSRLLFLRLVALAGG